MLSETGQSGKPGQRTHLAARPRRGHREHPAGRRGLGLGSVWTGGYPGMERVEILRRVLGIPESVIPMCLIWIGYPAEVTPSRTQYDEQRMHWQRYPQKADAEDNLA